MSPAWATGRTFGGTLALGTRPGLVVVDLQRGFTEPDGPLSCNAEAAVAAAHDLVEAAHRAKAPVWFTVIRYGPDEPLPLWSAKIPALEELRAGRAAADLDPRLGHRPGDEVVVKRGASAVFGTDLVDRIRAHGVDTVLLCGASTSGCVRSTAVDLIQSDLPAVLVPEACADRDAVQATATLTDLTAKYCDVLRLPEALNLFAVKNNDTGDTGS
ncbi:isochorismatase family protein [Streptomyces sp. NPDC052042]|uniref:isochorismatase family protein n=1 Tax=Streptomyces sp. NPDC052042 TaxID=3365683 RepID=UPI0037D4EF2C